MGNRDHLVEKTITDKNGHIRRVRVLPDSASKVGKKAARSLAPKQGAASVLTAEEEASRQQSLENLNAAYRHLSKDFDIFPLEMQKAAIEAANNPLLTDEDTALVDTVATACEDWNFHGTALRMWAALGRRWHSENPDAPFVHGYAIGFDSATPPETIRELFDRTEIKEGLHSIASNPSAPSDVISFYANYKEGWVREKAAGNPNLSRSDFDKLAADSEWRVQWRLAQNPSIPFDVLEKLASAENEYVAHEAQSTLKGKKS